MKLIYIKYKAELYLKKGNMNEEEFLKFDQNDIINLNIIGQIAAKKDGMNRLRFYVKELRIFDILNKDASILYNLLKRLINNDFQCIPNIINYKLQDSYIDKYYDMVKKLVRINYIETRNIAELKKETEEAKRLLKKNNFILNRFK